MGQRQGLGDALRPGLRIVGESGTEYEVLDRIGQGGVGSVFQVRNVTDGTLCVAKVLSPHRFHITTKGLRRFENEIRIQRALNHPGLIAVLDVVRRSRAAISIMEFAANGSLHDLLLSNDSKPLPSEPRTFILIWRLLDGLAALHRLGVVHRDVTPRNIVFRGPDHPAITDFGVARRESDPTITDSEDRLGSLIYISAQQRDRPHVAGFPDDVFSLGQVFFHMLTGRRPHGNPGDLRTLRRDLPPPLVDLIERMRKYETDERPPNAGVAAAEFISIAFRYAEIFGAPGLPDDVLRAASDHPKFGPSATLTLADRGLLSHSPESGQRLLLALKHDVRRLASLGVQKSLAAQPLEVGTLGALYAGSLEWESQEARDVVVTFLRGLGSRAATEILSVAPPSSTQSWIKPWAEFEVAFPSSLSPEPAIYGQSWSVSRLLAEVCSVDHDPLLTAVADESNWRRRSLAIEALGRLNDPGVAQFILGALADPVPFVQKEAILALRPLAPQLRLEKWQISGIVRMMLSQPEEMTASVCFTVTELAVRNPEVVDALGEILREGNWTAQVYAAVAVKTIGAPASGALPALTSALRTGNWVVKCRVAEALQALGHLAVGAIDALRDVALHPGPQHEELIRERAHCTAEEVETAARDAMRAIVAAG